MSESMAGMRHPGEDTCLDSCFYAVTLRDGRSAPGDSGVDQLACFGVCDRPAPLDL
jgi:hypothetical protein